MEEELKSKLSWTTLKFLIISIGVFALVFLFVKFVDYSNNLVIGNFFYDGSLIFLELIAITIVSVFYILAIIKNVSDFRKDNN